MVRPPEAHGVAVDVDLLGSGFMLDASTADTLAVQHASLLQLLGHPVIDVGVVLGAGVAPHDVHLGVVSWLLAVDSDEDVFEDAGGVDLRLRDAGHERSGFRLRAHCSRWDVRSKNLSAIIAG